MSADAPDDPGILLQVAQTMLGAMFDELPNLVAGRVPDGWPSSLVADKSVVVSLSSCEGWPCHEDARMPRHGTIIVPRLVAPPGVRWDGGRGSSSGGDHIDSHIRVTTNLSPADLLPFYARQLSDAGWTTGHSSATSAHAIQWLDANDRDGRAWHGLLTVYVNGSAREVFIYMAKVPD